MAAERAWRGEGLISSAADVGRILADVNAAGLSRNRTTAMAQAVSRAADAELTEPDVSRTLPVVPEIESLLYLNLESSSRLLASVNEGVEQRFNRRWGIGRRGRLSAVHADWPAKPGLRLAGCVDRVVGSHLIRQ